MPPQIPLLPPPRIPSKKLPTRANLPQQESMRKAAMLARTLVAEGKPAAAEAVRQAALRLYAADGWTPNDVKNAVAMR